MQNVRFDVPFFCMGYHCGTMRPAVKSKIPRYLVREVFRARESFGM
jgi:hypothetical protein